MKLLATIGALLVIATLLVAEGPVAVHASENGGMPCAACTLVIGLIEQAAQINNRTLTQQADIMCQWLPGFLSGVCQDIFNIVGPIIFPVVEDCGSADIACHFVTLCKDETAVCRLFPMPPPLQSEAEYRAKVSEYRENRLSLMEQVKVDLVSVVCEKSSRLCKYFHSFLGIPVPPSTTDIGVGPPQNPAFDSDKDMFSSYPQLRGYDWRGEDCDDLDATVFPGRLSEDALVDANCNGISGIDLTTGQSYEDEWCNNTGAMGVALLGDSATAHFRIPAEYVTASEWNSTTWNFLIELLENEGDWPMLSWGTGFMNTSSIPVGNVRGPMESLYNYLRTLNQCNHNDYQNIGVNGADSSNLKQWATLLARNRSDAIAPVKPIMVFLSMIGNDVCGSEQDFTHMTTPEAYLDNVVAGIMQVDSIVPSGSVVVLVPLVDGRILYDTMANRIHPVGKTNNDVTYADLYNYLNCLDVSPCWGWMNTNETVRNTTWRIASSLNAQLSVALELVKNRTQNVKVVYPGEVMTDTFAHTTIPRWELIEPVDGFHPSQTANALIAQAYWEALQNMSVLPPPNPNNAKILAKFGTQRRH